MAEKKRKPISKSVRFEIFKRDAFTCQYCGKTAPNVILECDHIIPVAEGGTNDTFNLITSCIDCNRGKGKRMLTDTQTVDRQRKHLAELNEMREQTEMMIEWRKELMELETHQSNEIAKMIQETGSVRVTDTGMQKLKKMVREFGFPEVMTAVEIAIEQYYDGTKESMTFAFAKIGGICYNRKKARGYSGN